ncbi:MotA/TolQ/ExbB proton channel family protein [Fuerstiella marisgermanici]|uniref:Colicin uptake protein n=1 Tax=Fuerstiella marisgermanici TaxID=1891926 RepID=A0A1P8WG61_9PLAN|nr:MotA/TolQ/ExbB proton channel family protein [Fuerstiella marisgermanici]APZ93061.1 colicin uptake protein [Fuerstiella marisgermanici]
MRIPKLRGPFNALRCVAFVLTTSLFLPAASVAQEPAADVAPVATPAMPSLWDLAVQGGWFMIPIAVASVITVAFTLERLFGLSRMRILPRKLVRQLRNVMNDPSFDPRKLWEACEGNRSPLANVTRAAVLKTGRPHAEVEMAVMDAVGRETAGMTRNLRPINVVASIAPLLGLLGTVQGMIMAFMVTSTTTSTGTAKAQELAHGIYTALVTTFAGLCVAVVSVILANFLEGRVERLLRQMEAIFLDLLPKLERYEGRLRVVESSDPGDRGIKVKSVSGGTASQKADADSAAAKKQAARKLGSPRRIVRSATGSEPAAAGADPDSDADLSGANRTARGTLRTNFDK